MTAREKKKRRLMVDQLTIWTTGAGSIMAVGDTVKQITGLPPIVAHYWPLVLFAALLIRTIGHSILTHLELKDLDQKENPDA